MSRVTIRSLADHMGTSKALPRFSDTGVRFKTLCLTCNSTKLGRWYDPELKRISSDVTKLLSATTVLSIPETLVVRVKPQRVARAIVGHLLASVPAEWTQQPLKDTDKPRTLREYFLDPYAPLPDSLSIFYWTYPSRRIVIARALVKVKSGYADIQMELLKFYPLGYVLVWDVPSARPSALAPLLANRAEGLDTDIELPIRLRGQPPLDFPEAPMEGEATFMAADATVNAVPRLTRGQEGKRRK